MGNNYKSINNYKSMNNYKTITLKLRHLRVFGAPRGRRVEMPCVEMTSGGGRVSVASGP